MIITIDGPAGTGKSTVAHEVARELGFDFLDTGAMYRAVGLAALRRKADMHDERELTFIAKMSRIVLDFSQQPPAVMLNGESVGHLLRSGDATQAASYVAVVPGVRELLVKQQQEIGAARPNIVTEGRDQGSVVFPHADLKIYLDANPTERTRRRAEQLRARGEVVNVEVLQKQIADRDQRDSSRAASPLTIPHGAEVIDTTDLSIPQVVEKIVAKAHALQQRSVKT